MTGDATLVPPKTRHAPCTNTATPVFGSATADTSATDRFAQPVSVWNAGLVCCAEHPLPAPDHALSDQPRALLSGSRLVPPTPVTFGDAAGYCTPKPRSPVLAVIATPGWSKN